MATNQKTVSLRTNTPKKMTFDLCYSLRLILKESNKKPIIQLHIHCVKKRQTFRNVNNSWRLVTTWLTGPKDWYKISWIHNGPKASLYSAISDFWLFGWDKNSAYSLNKHVLGHFLTNLLCKHDICTDSKKKLQFSETTSLVLT